MSTIKNFLKLHWWLAIVLWVACQSATLQAADDFQPAGYNEGKLLSLLYDGDLEKVHLMVERSRSFLYLETLITIFSQDHVAGDLLDQCVQLASPELRRQIKYGLSIRSEDVEKVIGLTMGMLQGQYMRFMAEAYRIQSANEFLVDSAKQDAAKLVKHYGCNSPVFKAIFGNIDSYVLAKPPISVRGFPAFRQSCTAYAMNRGANKSEAYERCHCISSLFEMSDLSRKQADWLANNMDFTKNFTTVVSSKRGLEENISQCLF